MHADEVVNTRSTGPTVAVILRFSTILQSCNPAILQCYNPLRSLTRPREAAKRCPMPVRVRLARLARLADYPITRLPNYPIQTGAFPCLS